jgi:hypothetical protein
LIGLSLKTYSIETADTSSDFDVADGVSVLAEQFVITVKT